MEVRKWNYGKYSSSNYGAHTTAIQVGTMTLYFSYDTVVAFSTPETGLVVVENQWGPTTGKHLNWINDRKDIRIPHDQFKEQLFDMLEKHNLYVPQ